jgi:hypothetical protein
MSVACGCYQKNSFHGGHHPILIMHITHRRGLLRQANKNSTYDVLFFSQVCAQQATQTDATPCRMHVLSTMQIAGKAAKKGAVPVHITIPLTLLPKSRALKSASESKIASILANQHCRAPPSQATKRSLMIPFGRELIMTTVSTLNARPLVRPVSV